MGIAFWIHWFAILHQPTRPLARPTSGPRYTANMAIVTFDTMKFAERKATGLPEVQARAIAEAQRDVFSEAWE